MDRLIDLEQVTTQGVIAAAILALEATARLRPGPWTPAAWLERRTRS